MNKAIDNTREELRALVEHLDKYERCRNCYHISSCDAWVRNATSLYDDYTYSVENCPYYVPAADVAEVRHGEWKCTTRAPKSADSYFYWDAPVETVFVCSECGRVEKQKEPYCHCGAKMDLKNSTQKPLLYADIDEIIDSVD